jgi:putative ABC transport system permease protein
MEHRRGDSITLPTPTGPRAKTILGVYFDYASNQGTILLDFAQYQRDFQDTSAARAPLGVSLHLKPGADPEVTRRRLLDQIGPHRSVYVVTNDRVRQEALRIFESTFAITYVLQSIAILIAGTSVITTLVRLIHERQKEIGLLSLVGASRRQIQTMIVLEATMIGAVSQLLGVAVGILLSIVLIFVINVQSFGWTIQFHLPLLFLLQSTVAIVLAAALFGLYPARKASGMDSLSTVREG